MVHPFIHLMMGPFPRRPKVISLGVYGWCNNVNEILDESVVDYDLKLLQEQYMVVFNPENKWVGWRTASPVGDGMDGSEGTS
jgi:hypothetical protein